MPSVSQAQLHFNAKNITGKRFGKLVALEVIGRNNRRSLRWKCKCDCGAVVERVGSTLLCGKSVSCGCNKFTTESNAKRGMLARKPGASIRKEFGHYRSGAKQRGYEFLLSFNDFSALVSMCCYYCGAYPNRLARTTYENAIINGIDRVDNSVGYKQDNCVACCSLCNFMKRNMSSAQFIEQCRRITDNNKVAQNSFS